MIGTSVPVSPPDDVVVFTSPRTIETIALPGFPASIPLRHPVTVPAGTWHLTVYLPGDGYADLSLELVSMKGVRRMADNIVASDLAAIVASYLTDRDDVADVIVNPTDDADVSVAEITTQGGRTFLLTLVGLRERG